jgi:hypothetical protein
MLGIRRATLAVLVVLVVKAAAHLAAALASGVTIMGAIEVVIVVVICGCFCRLCCCR